MDLASGNPNSGSRMNGGTSSLAASAAGVNPLVAGWAQQAVLTSARWTATMTILGGVSLVVAMLALRFGAEDIALQDMVRILSQALWEGETGAEGSDVSRVILLQVRLPRVLLGVLVGACLAAVGVGLQALLRNPLADPYVLGISSGTPLRQPEPDRSGP